MEKDPCRGVVYLTVLCDHSYLVSILFALLSLYLATFLMLLITFKYNNQLQCYNIAANLLLPEPVAVCIQAALKSGRKLSWKLQESARGTFV